MQISGVQSITPTTSQRSTPAAQENSGDRFEFQKDCQDQATWLADQCRNRFGCSPNDLMKGPAGFERFSQLAEEWRTAHPRN